MSSIENNYRDLGIEELQAVLLDKKRFNMHLRFKKKMGELSDFSLIKKVKKDIARILTCINEYKKGRRVSG